VLNSTEPMYDISASNTVQERSAPIITAGQPQAVLFESQIEARAPLRVALLTNSLSPHTLPLCEAISRRVQDFEAFLSADADRFHHFPRVRGGFAVTVQKSFNALRFLRRSSGHWHTNQIQIPYDTFRQLKRFRPDVMLSNQLGVRTILCALYRRKAPGTKLFLWATLSAHTEQKRAWYRRWIRKWLIRNIDAAFTNGQQGKAYLHALGFAGPIFIMPYTIDSRLFERKNYDPEPGHIRLFYCGRIDSQKGVRTFTLALNRWCSDHPERMVHLQMVGDGPDAGAVRSMVTASNLQVAVLERLSQEELAPFYKRADVFVLPTLEDEWGVVVNEAMSAGLPVLGSVYSQAVAELVDDGLSGWTYDPRSEESTQAVLTRALDSSPAELRRLSQQAQLRVAEISPARVASRAVEAMQSVARATVTSNPQPVAHSQKAASQVRSELS
jgi:glycosyltransferase involved in cell wall biosynthesis